jgi:GNAT superfamily N-acetyltransferase
MSGQQDNQTIETRLARPEDVPTISRVLFEAFIEYRPIYTPGGFAATTPPPEQILPRLGEGPVWVAFYQGTIAGTVSVVVKPKGLYIRSMAVLPSARGHSIARMLLERAEAFARENCCERMYLSTTPFLADAIKLYERNGFRRSPEGATDLFGTPIFTMLKTLEE